MDTAPTKPEPSSGGLLGLLVAAFYALFTLLPDSSSLVVSWYWVAVWQMGLLCPVLWWLSLIWQQRRIQLLGNQMDWMVALLVGGMVLSTLLAEFPNQARWNTWAAIGILAALYALNQWLETPQRRLRVLIGQGCLTLAFVLVSLALWVGQTLMPELSRLEGLRQYGVELPFDFSVLELRNWAPIGHQNYVAGYLVLALPLLVALGIIHRGWQRWLWISGGVLGLVTLYTTSSRGGWLGLMGLVVVVFGLALWRSSFPRRWLAIAGGIGFASLVLLVLANPRLRSLAVTILQGRAGGELGFRVINAVTGWAMGWEHPIVGAGPGSVPLLYQQYRPAWAGREAELVYQLHSTPVQIWAELGGVGVVSWLGTIGLLVWLGLRWLKSPHSGSESTLVLSLFGGLLAYSLTSLTDYQLDLPAISGTLVLYLAVLSSASRELPDSRPAPEILSASRAKTIATVTPLVGLGLVLAIVLWLVPIHRAWMLSSQGFAALQQLQTVSEPQRQQESLNLFVQRLSRAHQLAPWEPYYSYQLGWNLGNLGLQTAPPLQTQLVSDGMTWLQRGIDAAPYQEFGYSNLGWLAVAQGKFPQATDAFVRAIDLVPAKRGLFYGLGGSLLAQGKTDLAIEAFVLELLRDPILLTSPLWRSPQLSPLYPQVLTQLEARYTALIAENPQGYLKTYLHQCRGVLYWWMGNLKAAQADLETYGSLLSQSLLQLAQGKPVTVDPRSSTPGMLAIAAWQSPENRQALLQRAWIRASRTDPPADLVQQLLTTMNGSSSFDQWLKQNAPTRTYRRDRVGFGVLNRHIDGPIPSDFLLVVDNLPMATFFDGLLSPWLYFKDLDLAFQPQRASLLKTLSQTIQ